MDSGGRGETELSGRRASRLVFAQPASEPLVLNADAMTPQKEKAAGNRGGGPRQGGNRGGGRRGPGGERDGGFISKWLAAAVPAPGHCGFPKERPSACRRARGW